MKFITQTGSVYEVDEDKKQVRRLSGSQDPTPRQGEDGLWKSYVECPSIVEGQSVLFVWKIDQEVGGSILRSTVTSPVVEIIE